MSESTELVDTTALDYQIGAKKRNSFGRPFTSVSAVASRLERRIAQTAANDRDLRGHAEDMKYLVESGKRAALLERCQIWTDQYCQKHTYDVDGQQVRDWIMKDRDSPALSSITTLVPDNVQAADTSESEVRSQVHAPALPDVLNPAPTQDEIADAVAMTTPSSATRIATELTSVLDEFRTITDLKDRRIVEGIVRAFLTDFDKENEMMARQEERRKRRRVE